jgi:hypothetical protein
VKKEIEISLVRIERGQQVGRVSNADAGKVGVGVVLGMERTEKIAPSTCGKKE